MHKSLTNIRQHLEKVVAQLQSTVPNDEPLGNVHNNWGFPGLTRSELIDEAQSLIDRIDEEGGDEVGEHEAHLNDYIRRLQHLQQQTIPNIWGSASAAVPAYIFTLNGLRKALTPVLKPDEAREVAVRLRKVTTQVRGLEARINGLQPRTETLAAMVERIEHAYNAADQLPADLESLAEARHKVAELVENATKDQVRLQGIREHADNIDAQLNKSAEEAEAVLQRCETAYSAATSVGLAAAFTERSSALSISMWIWVVGLVGALFAGSVFGAGRLEALVELFKDPNQPSSVVVPNVILSLLSIGAPIWFAWLSTKQIGQRFRLSEDYAFKASIARAYEGFRREAARVDREMEARLLASALTRLDELPLRLVETESHGSPWHELANSDVVKQALRTAPSFAGQVKELAEKTIAKVPSGKTIRVPKPEPAAEE
ncbi:hypothetical protein [Microvirga sp. CF3016]|uniref:hypothetical protein n=1 Tax=Microvirga sp. CF3016 TaxID=3110181 RepID=UPI002E78412C|nr:hypothetical protein [Microvirga sp. CF3016]MEE1612086.1 hypothetical protein [Microvirga sp. CF3016]